MANAAKKTAKVSKGERDSVARRDVKAGRRARTADERQAFKLKAWKRKKNPWLTIENPNPDYPAGAKGTNKKYIRVRADTVWGSPIPKKEDLKNQDNN